MLAYEYLPPATKAVACTALRSQNLLLFPISPFFLIFFSFDLLLFRQKLFMKKVYYYLILSALLPLQLFAQNTIRGRVTDSTDGAPLPQVTVTVTGAGQQAVTTTNLRGEYTLDVPATATALVFSFTGMTPITEPING